MFSFCLAPPSPGREGSYSIVARARPEPERESKPMPAEQALTRARGLSGPSHGPADGGSRSSGARLEQMAALFAPVALIVGLALSGGGFDVSERHIAGLRRLARGRRPARARRRLAALGSAGRSTRQRGCSAVWRCCLQFHPSGRALMELSVIEADRVLVYLAFFLAAFLIAQTDERRQRFAEGIAIGVTIVVLLGLGSRLLPQSCSRSPKGSGPGRGCSYPLGYWNANAALCGIAVAAAALDEPRIAAGPRCAGRRWRPSRPSALTLYFTYSRGGVVALAVGGALHRSPSRGTGSGLLATLAVGAPRRAAGADRDPGLPQPRRQRRLSNIRRPGRLGAAHPARRDGARARPLRPPARGWRRATGRAPARAVEISRDPKVLQGRRRRRSAVAAIGRRDRLRRPGLGPVLRLRHRVPRRPRPALRRLRQRRPRRLLAGRGRRLRGKAVGRTRGRDLRVLLGAAALDRPRPDRRPLPLPGGVRRARPARRAARPRRSVGEPALGRASRPGAPRRYPRARPTPRSSPRCSIFAVAAGFDWFWEIAGAGGGLLPRRRCPGRGALRAARRRRGEEAARERPLRCRRRRRRPRLARGDRPDRPPAGRARDRRQQGRRRRRQRQQRRRPRRDRPLDRALGRLPLPAARPDRRAPGRIRPRRAAAERGDRPRGGQLGALRAALQGRGRGRRRGRRAGRPRKGP